METQVQTAPRHLHIDKPDTMQTEKVHITVDGLEPNCNYKLVMFLDHLYGQHKAFAVFKADSAGCIDLMTAKPLRGTYFDADPMGLFISQMPQPSFEWGGYVKCTPPIPFYYDLALYDSTDKLIETMTIKKHWVHPSLQRTEIEEHGFRGTLYKPPGDGPFVGIIDISGTGGGLHEHKGAMLASEGFVVLCVAYFQYKDLPFHLKDFDITYFKNPVNFMMTRPYIRKDIGLGLQGVSLGGTLCDYLAIRHPEFKAICSINGAYGITSYLEMKENGIVMPQMKIDDSLYEIRNHVWVADRCFKTTVDYVAENPKDDIEYEKIPKDCKFRLITAVDDLCAAPIAANTRRYKKLKEMGIHVEHEMCNGGHIVEPPYFPHHDMVYSKYLSSFNGYGGEVCLHGKSQEYTWSRTVDFFYRFLDKPKPLPEWNRSTKIIKPTRAQQVELVKSQTKCYCPKL